MSPWRDELSELEKNLNGPIFIVNTPGYEGEVAGRPQYRARTIAASRC